MQQKPARLLTKYKDPEGGGEITAKFGKTPFNSGSSVVKGATIVFTAKPEKDYKVQHWSINDKTENNTDTTYSLKVTEPTTTVEVRFIKTSDTTPHPDPTPKQKHKISFSVNGGNGTLKAVVDGKDISTGAEVEEDKSVIFTAEPAAGYMVENWKGLTPETPNATTVTYAVKKAVTVTVTFKQLPAETFTVTMKKPEHGSLSVNPGLLPENKAAKDTKLSFTATPEAGYQVENWTITDGSFEAGTGTAGNTVAKVKVTANFAIEVRFKPTEVEYTINHLKQNTDGSGYEEPTKQTKRGITGTQTAAKAEPYEGFDSLNFEQQTIKGDGSTVVDIKYNRKDITLTLNLDGGTTTTVLDGDKLKGKYGAAVTVENPTKPGYSFKGWVPALPSTFPSQYKAESSYSAQWKKLHKITFSPAPKKPNGSITATVDGTKIESPASVEEGATVEFTATADTDYEVGNWSIEGSSFEAGTGTSGSTAAKVKVGTNAVTVMVEFLPSYKKVTYTDLENYVKNTASADKVNYIEITGNIPPDAFTLDGSSEKLKAKIQTTTKKIALKLPEKIEGLTNMTGCFDKCTNLVSVANIPEGVTHMSFCFAECTNLESAANIPEGVKEMTGAFLKCKNLIEAPVFPETVQRIDRCFEDCSSLTQAPEIPKQVLEMTGCFQNCSSLKTTPKIHAKIQNMSECFKGCTSLTTAEMLPESVEMMVECFKGCTTLETVTNIPRKTARMPFCFADCTNLKTLPDIPETIIDMVGCFSGCSALKQVTLHCPYTLANYYQIGEAFKAIFKDCTALENGGIQVPTAYFNDYTGEAALNLMEVPGTSTEEKKAKFKAF